MSQKHPQTATSHLIVNRYYSEFDGLRAIAILLVIVFHSALSIINVDDTLDAPKTFLSFLMAGWCGVDLFFVISGFLITGILIDTASIPNNLSKFYIRRILRIFPLYYAAITVYFISVFWSKNIRLLPSDITYLLYMQNFFHEAHHPIDFLGHFWSLAVEEQFYVFWPLIFLSFYNRSKPLLFCSIFLLMAFAEYSRIMMVEQGLNVLAYKWTFTRIDSLLAGALVALLIRSSNLRKLNSYAQLGMVISAIVIVIIAVTNKKFYSLESPVLKYGLSANALFFASLIAWLFTSSRNIWKYLLGSRLLVSTGKISYGIYIFHWIIVALLVHSRFYDSDKGFLYNFATVLLQTLFLSYGLAYLSFHLFEKKFLLLKNKYAPY